MTTWIALLRGVNVGGTGRLPMAVWRAGLTGMGLAGVQTHIQSGNAVFRSDRDRADLAPAIAAGVAEVAGFRPEVVLLTAAELDGVIAANPFSHVDPTRVTALICPAAPAPDSARLDALAAASERWHLSGCVVYLHAPEGTGRSRLAAALPRLLGQPATGRNLRTLQALAERARALTVP